MLSATIQAAPSELARQLQWPERHWIPHLIPFQMCHLLCDWRPVLNIHILWTRANICQQPGWVFFLISFQFSPSFCVVSYTCIHFKYQRNVKTLF